MPNFQIKQYGLIGHPLTHSFSKSYFTDKFFREGVDASYENFDLADITEFPELLKEHPHLKGLNVTIPYKEAIIPYLTGLDSAAKAIGAVNTIVYKTGELIGYNTDYLGFIGAIQPLLFHDDKKALVLGTGGSSKAVIYGLRKIGIDYLVVSRTPLDKEVAYDAIDATVLEEYSIIINTTPIGMFPDVGQAPRIPYHLLSPKHLLFDLIYNPAETLFLRQGREAGARIKNGLEMLEVQAEEAWEIWNG